MLLGIASLVLQSVCQVQVLLSIYALYGTALYRSHEFVEQHPGLLQVGGVESLGDQP